MAIELVGVKDEDLVIALANRVLEVDIQLLCDTRAKVENETPINTLADSLAWVQKETVCNTLAKVEFETLAFTLAALECKALIDALAERVAEVYFQTHGDVLIDPFSTFLTKQPNFKESHSCPRFS